MKFRKTVREDINFWPGYVDALINVVLNLLFLVGIFIVGLVSFNSVALSVHRQAVQWRLSGVMDKPPAHERQANAREMLAGIDRKAPEEPLPPPQAPFKPLPLTKEAPTSVWPVPPLPLVLPPSPPPAPVAAALPPPSPVVREIRIARESGGTATRANAAPGGLQAAARAAEQMGGGGQAVAQLRFAINQYTLADGAALSAALSQHPDADWQLVVFTDPANDRLSREAYARLLAVRDQMLAGGVPTERVQLRIAAAPVPSAELDRTLFLVARSR